MRTRVIFIIIQKILKSERTDYGSTSWITCDIVHFPLQLMPRSQGCCALNSIVWTIVDTPYYGGGTISTRFGRMLWDKIDVSQFLDNCIDVHKTWESVRWIWWSCLVSSGQSVYIKAVVFEFPTALQPTNNIEILFSKTTRKLSVSRFVFRPNADWLLQKHEAPQDVCCNPQRGGDGYYDIVERWYQRPHDAHRTQDPYSLSPLFSRTPKCGKNEVVCGTLCCPPTGICGTIAPGKHTCLFCTGKGFPWGESRCCAE